MAMSYERAQRCADPSGVSFVIISASPGADCVVVVVPARELDLLTCPALYRHLVEQLDCGAYRVLVVDFSLVEFLGAAGLGVLVEVGDRAELCGVELRVVVCSGPVWRPLRLTGLVGEFAIYENLAQALTGAPSGLQRAGGRSR
jgi:anti-anti-sigma factor